MHNSVWLFLAQNQSLGILFPILITFGTFYPQWLLEEPSCCSSCAVRHMLDQWQFSGLSHLIRVQIFDDLLNWTAVATSPELHAKISVQ
jgi:hypothetical protein